MTAIAELTEAQRVALIDPNDLPKLWDQLEPLIEKGCQWSRETLDKKSVVDGVLCGDFRLLAYMDGDEVLSIAVTTVSQFPTGTRVAEILIIGGEGMKDWVKFENQVETYFKREGCRRFRILCRDGIQRMLPHWKRVSVVLEKEFA